ncbi:MAG: DUF4878 domain-containing protein [Planctomycetes bacterium]|nr:DUF4878 domain-containing protein [Planctomycetota bacterium]
MICALALAGLAFGCGGGEGDSGAKDDGKKSEGDSKGTSDKPAELKRDLATPSGTARTFFAAFKAKDKVAISACVSDTAAGDVGAFKKCEFPPEEFDAMSKEFGTGAVTGERIDGDRAEVDVTWKNEDGDEQKEKFKLAKEGNDWKIVDF